MADLPQHVKIYEEGPREGFQIEPGLIPTLDKIRLIEALAENGGCATSRSVLLSAQRWFPAGRMRTLSSAGFRARQGVHYSALWFNAKGLQRALSARSKLTVAGSISLTASDAFTRKNLHRSRAENLEAMRELTRAHLEVGVPVTRIGIMAAFGCNYQGDVAPADAIRTIEEGFALASEFGLAIDDLSLADTMGWAAPHRVERVVGDVRSR